MDRERCEKGFDCVNRLVGVLGWLCRQALTMYWAGCVNGFVCEKGLSV